MLITDKIEEVPETRDQSRKNNNFQNFWHIQISGGFYLILPNVYPPENIIQKPGGFNNFYTLQNPPGFYFPGGFGNFFRRRTPRKNPGGPGKKCVADPPDPPKLSVDQKG